MGTIFRSAFLVCLWLVVPAFADEAKPPAGMETRPAGMEKPPAGTEKPPAGKEGPATDAPTSPPTPERLTLETFGREQPACREWSDGCAVCTRAGDALACSLPGIACTPTAVTCRAETEKKDAAPPEPPPAK